MTLVSSPSAQHLCLELLIGSWATPFPGIRLGTKRPGPGPSLVGGLPGPKGPSGVGVSFPFLAGLLQVFSNVPQSPQSWVTPRRNPGSGAWRTGFGWGWLPVVTPSAPWSVQWVSSARPHGTLGISLKVETGDSRLTVALPGGGTCSTLPPADLCAAGSSAGWPPWQSGPGAQLPVVLLMFSFCLSDASPLNYLPREFGLLHLWFWQGLHTNVLPWWSLSRLR